MLRHTADLKTLMWMAVTTALLVTLWHGDGVVWWLYLPFVYLSVSAAIIAHNHNHVRMWRSRFLNHLTDHWITVFYGFPTFAWIPTHNKNHHRYNNTRPDHTHTWRFWEANSLLTLIAYPAISGFFQQPAIGRYLADLRARDKRRFFACASQIAFLLTWIGVAFVLDWRKALLYVIVPQQVSLASVLVFNYLQHVHADEENEWNHSRNITGPVLNFLMFNNGFHTVHHMRPGLHWSLTPAEHRRVAHHIEPTLNEPSLAWYLGRTYLLAPVIPSLRRPSMRLARQEAA